MPKIDFSKYDDVDDYSPLPEGSYVCAVSSIEEAYTKAGDEMWKLQLDVIEGEFEGRRIFDNLVFSEKAMKRVKLVVSRLGIDVSGEIDLTPEMLQGRVALVSVVVEEYENAAGETKKRNSVLFAGYERAGDDAAAEGYQGDEDDCPF